MGRGRDSERQNLGKREKACVGEERERRERKEIYCAPPLTPLSPTYGLLPKKTSCDHGAGIQRSYRSAIDHVSQG